MKFAKVIAANTDLSSAQAFVYQTPNLSLGVLISGMGDDVFTKIRQATVDLSNKFFELEDNLSQRLNLSYGILSSQLQGLESLEVILIVWQENVLYIQSIGEHSVYLLRAKGLVKLTPSHLDSPELISGLIETGDKVLVMTKSLQKVFGNENIKNLFNIHIDSFEEEIISLLPQEQLEPVAAMLLDFSLQEVIGFPAAENKPRFITLPKFRLLLPKNILELKKFFKITFLVILLFLFLIGGIFFYYKKKIEKNNQFLSQFAVAKEKFTQAKNLKDTDLASAISNIDQAKENLKKILAVAPNDEQALKLKQEISEQAEDITKQHIVSDTQLFLDLRLVKEGFMAKKMSASVNKILLLDDDKKTLVLIDLDQKTNQILAGKDQLGNALSASLNGDFAFVYSKDRGILRIETKNQKVKIVQSLDEKWGQIVDLVGFGSNFYLLDSKISKVWKYVPTGSGYSSKISYLDDNFDLGLSKSMLIDGSVWILKPGNELIKFTKGVKDFFSVNGLPQSLGLVNTFFVSDKTDNVYLLDKGNSLLMVLDKKGKFISQYQSEYFRSADDLMVDELSKIVYILEENKIYKFSLK